MDHNFFLLRGLSFLPDHVLLRAAAEYEQARLMLTGEGEPGAATLRSQLEEALATIAAELSGRGTPMQTARR